MKNREKENDQQCVCVRERGEREPSIANNTSSIISFNVSKENNCLAAREGKLVIVFEDRERERTSRE